MSEVTKDIKNENAAQKHRPYTADFTDFDGAEQRKTLRISRPGRKELSLMAKTPKNKQFDTMCKVMTKLIHPEDAPALAEIIEDNPALALAFIDGLMSSCGVGSVTPGN